MRQTNKLGAIRGAFALVCRDYPARLLLVGEGPYRPVIERLIEQHGLTGRVLLLGQRNDIPALLRGADIFLFCSRTEGLPNAVLEAMAAGLPVVATDVPGCRDLITTGQSGYLVPVGAVGKIAECLGQFLVMDVGQ